MNPAEITCSFLHWSTVFVPCDERTWNSLGEASQRQGGAAVHLLVSQILTEPWVLSCCIEQKHRT